MQLFNIYPDAIDMAEEVCNEALEGAKSLASKYGTNYDYDVLNISLIDYAVQRLDEIGGEWSDITNSIISAMFTETENALNNCKLFNEAGITFNSYTNCHDSHLYMNFPDDSAIRIVEETSVLDGYMVYLTDKLHTAIEEYISEQADGEPTVQYPKEFVEEDIESGVIDEADIAVFVATGVLTENVIQNVIENAEPKETEKGEQLLSDGQPKKTNKQQNVDR